MTFTEWDIEVIGYVGGFFLSISLLPQLWVTFQTKSTKDISYLFMVFYLAGLIFTLFYYILLNATAGWVTVTFEVLCGVLLLLMKFWYEHGYQRSVEGATVPDHFSKIAVTPPVAPPSFEKNPGLESVDNRNNSQLSVVIEAGKANDPSLKEMNSQSEEASEKKEANF